MSARRRNPKFVILVVLSAAALVALLYWRPAPPTGPAEGSPQTSAASALADQLRHARSPGELRQLLLPANPASPGVRTAPPGAGAPAAPPETPLDKITAAFERLNSEERTLVAEQAVVDLEDDQFPALLPLLASPTLPVEVIDVLMADALSRPDRLALPAMLEVARTPQHPRAEDALDVLKLYLETDHGNDWAAWQASLDAWLAARRDSKDSNQGI